MRLRLSTSERIVAWRLALGGDCSRDGLIWHLWGGDEPSEASAEDYLRVIVCALRKKVAPLGIKIGTVRQLGYCAVNRALMLDVLAREAEANCFPTPYARRTRDTRGESHVHA